MKRCIYLIGFLIFYTIPNRLTVKVYQLLQGKPYLKVDFDICDQICGGNSRR